MTEKEDVFGPRKIIGVLRAADDETRLGPLSRRLYEKRLQGPLAIVRISAEIGQRGAVSLWRSSRPVTVGIDTAIHGRDPCRAEVLTKGGECRASSIAQH